LNKINLYFITPPIGYKWIPGDRAVVYFFKKLFERQKISGIEKVFLNLCKGFDELNLDYSVNLDFKKIKPYEPVIVLGAGREGLKGYRQPNPIIAGIALMTHPSEWPSLCKDYPVVKYLQHSDWARNVYVPYYGAEICDTWPVGIETDKWSHDENIPKTVDVLVYNKIRWNKSQLDTELRLPVLEGLARRGLTYREIVYGNYKEAEYFELLRHAKSMVFLCEHESQGIACCEALSMNVPVFAWDQGFCLDPNRFGWGDPVIPATSVPFFDDTCGMKFKDAKEFASRFNIFWDKVQSGAYQPRQYILNKLTLKKSAERMLEIVSSIYK
jgi:hypothetical protein